jgi:putative monooxygenase
MGAEVPGPDAFFDYLCACRRVSALAVGAKEKPIMAIETTGTGASRTESIHPGRAKASSLGAGVWIREFASGACGAVGFSTGTATLEAGAVLPYHNHSFSEVITILSGTACAAAEGRSYLLKPFDAMHFPANLAHEVTNVSPDSPLVALWAFASAEPTRQPVDQSFVVVNHGLSSPPPDVPEAITRFAEAEIYFLSEGAEFRDLFAGRFGSVGICGGYGRFRPGASLPCHVHQFDESITIVEGDAICLVQGKRYRLNGCDTAFVPEARPHRFLNQSESPMAMVWVYSGSEPERTLVDPAYCDGTLSWPGSE